MGDETQCNSWNLLKYVFKHCLFIHSFLPFHWFSDRSRNSDFFLSIQHLVANSNKSGKPQGRECSTTFDLPEFENKCFKWEYLNFLSRRLNASIGGKYFSYKFLGLFFIGQWKFYNIAFLFCLNCLESQSKIWGSTLATSYVFEHNYFSWFERALVLFIDFSAQLNIVLSL